MPRLPRRTVLSGLSGWLSSVAFGSLLAEESETGSTRAGPLTPKAPDWPARAKRCVFVFLEGGPSHIDTFDPKPALARLHGKQFVRQDPFASAMASGTRYYVQSPFQFRQVGPDGFQMNVEFEELAGVADQLCLYRGLQAESINHPTACYHLNTGNRFGGDPALGAWTTYGLGTVNQNLPAYVVLPERAYPQGGAANWSNGFLPAHFQGTTLRPSGAPILDLQPFDTPPNVQRANLDLLEQLNAGHRREHPHEADLEARMAAYELAFRMQAEVPSLIDISGESKTTLANYGLDAKPTEEMGRKCLLARRLLEAGVRFVQIYSGGWDSHDYIERSHRARIRSIDRPLAALIADLKQRGMLDDTLLVICGEFGRSPDNGLRGGGVAYGRDHNAQAMFVLLAGGDVPKGRVVGATDEIGGKAVDVVHPIKNLHVTLLRLLGLDDNKLTFFHGGRFKQLSQTGGQPINELISS